MAKEKQVSDLDLIKALYLRTTKGRISNELSRVNKTLEELIGGKIERTEQEEQPLVQNQTLVKAKRGRRCAACAAIVRCGGE